MRSATKSYRFQVNNIERPSQYEAAIRSKERAREDIQVSVISKYYLCLQANVP